MARDNQDLTKGPLARKILFFSAPLIVSNLLQVLFNVADIAVVGRFAGASQAQTAAANPHLPSCSWVSMKPLQAELF